LEVRRGTKKINRVESGVGTGNGQRPEEKTKTNIYRWGTKRASQDLAIWEGKKNETFSAATGAIPSRHREKKELTPYSKTQKKTKSKKKVYGGKLSPGGLPKKNW